MSENAIIVESDPSMANLLALALAYHPNSDYEIRKVSTPLDLVESITEHPPSLVVIGETNEELPVNTICRLIRKNSTKFYPDITPFIAVIRFPGQDSLAYSSKEIAQKINSDIYIPRPFSLERTISEIQKIKALRR
jgi:DNA-binding response OmpR family regulator